MIPPKPRKNRRIIIDGSSFFWGWGRPIDGYESNVITCVRLPKPLDPVMLELRNAAIIEAWSCPIRLKKQSDHQRKIRLQGQTKHSAPGYKERISAAMKTAFANPEVRAKCSEAKKQYWEQWRAKNGKAKGKQYL